MPSVTTWDPHGRGPGIEVSGHPSEAVLLEALSTLRAGFVLVDEEGNLISEVDPVLLDLGIHDFRPATLAAFRDRAVVPEGDPLPAGYTPVADAIFRDVPMVDVLLGFRVEGENRRWVRFNSRKVTIDGATRILITAVDVTQIRDAEDRRRELEAAVVAEQRRFTVVFEHIGDVISVFDIAGNVMFGTPSGERILGWPFGYRAEGGVLGLVHPEDRDRAAAALASVVDGSRGPTDAVTLRIQTAWGDWRYMECVGVNMLDEPAIGGIMVTARDVTKRHRLTLALEHAATHDQLTGLPNRTIFREHLAAALARTERNESRVAVCYLDIDEFKQVNDEYGHASGDLLLQEIAQRVRDCLRPADVPSRLGGDELALILEGVDRTAAMRVARRLRDRLREPYEIGEGTVSCGASIGVALARSGDTPESWLARADSALYRAKAAGRHLVRCAPDVA